MFSGRPNARTPGPGKRFEGPLGTLRGRGEGAAGPGPQSRRALEGARGRRLRPWPPSPVGVAGPTPRVPQPPPRPRGPAGEVWPSCWRRPPSRRPPDSAATTWPCSRRGDPVPRARVYPIRLPEKVSRGGEYPYSAMGTELRLQRFHPDFTICEALGHAGRVL
ncbi:collagen alpha-1(I) chain-like [Suricata suricatta]|uniref:collagen alpha-1(I) chain-like n=1 Tax=Suricata suricatta TaxID=37032 RepID=UPI001155F3E8|nr:collagen alpha-1(I) chain-like [Suricata suricatta]